MVPSPFLYPIVANAAILLERLGRLTVVDGT